MAVHPHLRGEYAKRRRGEEIHYLGRFTPTCVGNTFAKARRSRKRSVHPHLRGEYVRRVFHFSTAAGSPPPAWGIPDIRKDAAVASRFTPTCVGNTSAILDRYRAYSGSPPPAWGILFFSHCTCLLLRFTPTCVGNTRRRRARRSARSVHPHLRGEYFQTVVNVAPALGSPPPAWGIRAKEFDDS